MRTEFELARKLPTWLRPILLLGVTSVTPSRDAKHIVLANVLAARGELDEALAVSEVAEGLADEDDAWSQAAWRTARAQVLAARGKANEAGGLADEAAALVRGQDDLLVRVDTLETVASVLEAIGRTQEAEATLSEVLALHEAKMDTVSARRVSERLAALRVA